MADVVGILTATIYAVLTVLLDVKRHLNIVMTTLKGAGLHFISGLPVAGLLTIPDLHLGAALDLTVILQNSLLRPMLWPFLGMIGIVIQEMTCRDYYLECD